MFFVLALSVLIFIAKHHTSSLMIVTKGTPTSFTDIWTLSYSNWNKCVEYCVNTTRCVAIYQNGSRATCNQFQVNMLQTVQRSEDSDQKFAYKIDGTMCPVNDTIGGKGGVYATDMNVGKTVYTQYSVTYDLPNSIWNFQSIGRVACLKTYDQMFFRSAGPWCMTFYTGSCNNKTQAQGLCKGQLSGLDSETEYNYLRLSTARWANYTQFSGAWLDGQRKPECVGQTTDACQGIKAFQFTDPTLSANPAGYHFNPGKPDANSGDCLGYRVNADKTFGVENFPCDTTLNATLNICFQGYLCGVVPVPV